MKIFHLPILFGALSLTILAQEQTQKPAGPSPAQLEAREELNRSAAEYRAGHFAEAQQHAERALTLDPSNRTAPIFIARIIHQQYRIGDESVANVARAREAIDAYQRILAFDSQNEEAYKAIAVLYAEIHDDQSLIDWITKRAINPDFSNEKRAEAYTVLAGKYWDYAFKTTELPEAKVSETRNGKTTVVYKKPARESDFRKLKECTAKGLEMAEVALGLDVNQEAAWAYKSALLSEKAKLADMEGDYRAKAGFEKAAGEAGAQARILAARRGAEPRP